MDFFSLFNLFNSFKGCSGLNCFISKSFKFTLGANLIISSYIRQNRINPLLYPWYGQPCTSYPSKLCKQNHNENDWFYPVILSDIFTPLRWGLQNSFGFLIRVQKRDLFFKYPNIHDFFHWKSSKTWTLSTTISHSFEGTYTANERLFIRLSLLKHRILIYWLNDS